MWQGEIAGSASAVLIGASRGAHMLVVGNRGFGAYGSAMLGSVSSAVARHAECPVTVVRGVVEDPARRRVVTVGVDYLQPDASTVRFAADQASRWGVPLRIVSAWAPPLLEAPSLGRSAAPEEDPWSNTRRSMASAAVSNAAKLARGIAPDLAIEVSTPESRAAPTLEEDSRRSSLVVLGSRHLQPQEAMAPSSVSCALLNHASCPVTIAPGEPLLVSRSTSRP